MRDDPDAPTLIRSRAGADTETSFDDDGSLESRYVLTGRLGVGAMGEVHLCADRRTGREVALKVARTDASQDAPMRARFLHEARIQAQLEHPSIPPVYDLGRDATGAPYFTMKRVHGVTLKRVLQSLAAGEVEAEAQYTRRRLLTAFAGVCMTVHYAHTRGVLHRDLKPSNIMLGEYGELYVLDWGVARVASSQDRPSTPARLAPSPDMTEAGDIIGTPGYIAPEHLRREANDERSDVYALGAILFEILALAPLHPVGEGAALVRMLKPVDGRPSARAPDRGVPMELDAICAKATAFDPKERYASARALHDAVERYLEGDRDLERRRQTSAEHAREAQEIATAVLRAQDPESEATQRARAIAEVSRALGFDPENGDARRVLLQLLTEPPRHVPPEVQDLIERRRHEQNQRAARGGLVFYGAFFLAAPLTSPVLGAHMGWFVWVWTALFGAAAASLLRLARAPYQGPKTRYATVICTMLALSSLSALDGPLILVPMLLIANEVALLMQPNRNRRAAILGTACAAILAPLALEWVGLVPPSYVLDHGRTIVQNRIMDFTPTTHNLLIAGTVAGVVAIGVYFIRFRDMLTDAEQRLYLFAWQLRQLVPDAGGRANAP